MPRGRALYTLHGWRRGGFGCTVPRPLAPVALVHLGQPFLQRRARLDRRGEGGIHGGSSLGDALARVEPLLPKVHIVTARSRLAATQALRRLVARNGSRSRHRPQRRGRRGHRFQGSARRAGRNPALTVRSPPPWPRHLSSDASLASVHTIKRRLHVPKALSTARLTTLAYGTTPLLHCIFTVDRRCL